MNDCKGWMGHVFGHKYEPVFDKTPPVGMSDIKGSESGVVAFIEAMSTKKHVRTICARCGDVIEAAMP